MNGVNQSSTTYSALAVIMVIMCTVFGVAWLVLVVSQMLRSAKKQREARAPNGTRASKSWDGTVNSNRPGHTVAFGGPALASSGAAKSSTHVGVGVGPVGTKRGAPPPPPSVTPASVTPGGGGGASRILNPTRRPSLYARLQASRASRVAGVGGAGATGGASCESHPGPEPAQSPHATPDTKGGDLGSVAVGPVVTTSPIGLARQGSAGRGLAGALARSQMATSRITLAPAGQAVAGSRTVQHPLSTEGPAPVADHNALDVSAGLDGVAWVNPLFERLRIRPGSPAVGV